MSYRNFTQNEIQSTVVERIEARLLEQGKNPRSCSGKEYRQAMHHVLDHDLALKVAYAGGTADEEIIVGW